MQSRLIKLILTSLMVLVLILTGCATATESGAATPRTALPFAKSERVDPAAAAVIARAYAALSTPGGKVLKSAIELVDQGVIVKGSCYDFINTAYDKAGFRPEKRIQVYMDAETGPYADPGILMPGDWVMFRNLAYGQIGHSAIFVEWIDFDRRSALIIEYAGEQRNQPGRFREADLFKTFGVVRGRE